jgi:hypothetical protein
VKEHGLTLTAPEVRAFLRSESPKTVLRRPMTWRNSMFGSAPRLFWDHASFKRAWVDGKGSNEQYLHVPCHRGDAEYLSTLDAHWKEKGQEHGYREAFPDCSPCEVCDYQGWPMTSHRLYSRVQPGTRIWGRERINANYQGSGSWRQRTGEASTYGRKTLRPATSDVLSVKAERLQDITEEDAKREGMVFTEHPSRRSGTMSIDGGKTFHPYTTPEPGWSAEPDAPPDRCLTTARLAFGNLWNKSYGKSFPWEGNPLVWRYELRRAA